MSSAFFEASTPLVFAHRGGGAAAPENTLAAFDLGLASGADGLELDVRLSRDGVVVVHHDARLERTTNLDGPVAARSADELSRADAAFRFCRDGAYPLRGRGVAVPTLAAVLRRYRDTRLIIEMKVNSAEMARATIDIIRAADAMERVCLGSFGWRVLHTARSIEPSIATSASKEEVRLALYRSWCGWPVSRAPYSGFQVPEKSGATRVVSRRFVEVAHRTGRAVQVWTVDTEADGRRLLDWRVDGLITDRPEVIVPLVRGQLPCGLRGDRHVAREP